MNDRETIIRVLKDIANDKRMLNHADYWALICAEAAELLKAQEQVEPVFDEGDGTTIGWFLCGKCHAKIGFGHPHFCWYCGRAVKWDD